MLVADINIQGVQETAEKSKQHATHPEYRALSVMVDVTDPASVQEMVDAAVKEFGRIDYSVNSAGVSDIPTQSPFRPRNRYTSVHTQDIPDLHTVLDWQRINGSNIGPIPRPIRNDQQHQRKGYHALCARRIKGHVGAGAIVLRRSPWAPKPRSRVDYQLGFCCVLHGF